MLLTKAVGVLASLCVAVAAHPAPSETSADAIHPSTLPAKQALYARVFSDAVMGLLSNVSSLPPDSIASPRRHGGLRPHFKRELVDEITTKAVRQLLPPVVPWFNETDENVRWRKLLEWFHDHPNVDIDVRPFKPSSLPGVDGRPPLSNWSSPVNVSGRAEVIRANVPRDLHLTIGQPPNAPFNSSSCPGLPFPFNQPNAPKPGLGYLNYSSCPPTWHPLPRPWALNQTAPINLTVHAEPHHPILPRGELRSAIAKESTPKDLRSSILAQARATKLSAADIDVLDNAIDDAEEIVQAAQIRAANVKHSQYRSSYRVTERSWCICKIVGCTRCPNKVQEEKAKRYDDADAIMAHLRS